MNVAAKQQSKFHGPVPQREATQVLDQKPGGTQNQFIKSSIDGEVNDMPGGHSAQFVTTDYGEQRHMAYDSPLAQPAYSGHGKVRVGSTSAL